MDRALEELLALSHAVGGDEDEVQISGGNTSVKTDRGTMLIKASGATLAGVREDFGWVELRLPAVLDLLDDERLQSAPDKQREAELLDHLARARVAGPGERPSVESVVHALLGTYVVHTHPVAANAYGWAEGGAEECDGSADGGQTLWIPYCDPGYPLALELRERMNAWNGSPPQDIMQENHGLFVHDETADDAVARHRRFLERCRNSRPSAPPPNAAPDISPERVREIATAIRRAHARIAHPDEDRIECHRAPLVRLCRREDLASAAGNEPDIADLTEGCMTPDHIVFAGSKTLRIANGAGAGEIVDAAKKYVEAIGVFPKFAVAEGEGVFAIADSPWELDAGEVVQASVVRAVRAIRAAGRVPRRMKQRDVDYILGWEVEHYRKALFAGAGDTPLEGRVAVVTGAGSGLGRSIAAGLVKAGAFVFFTDVDVPAAEQAAADASPDGKTRGFALQMDVTDESSVAEAFDEVCARMGGVDIAINCAGIAPAFELTEYPLDKWRLALEINLTGYLLVSREAARVMKRQRCGGSILCLSSKSGLEASKANSAYNATKAGELHMARGWALELAPDCIRVNCIAPGNVFEGSKIWNAAYIEQAAKKKGIRPDEVIPHYVSLSPLQKEIKGRDVADAAVFLCSDAARRITGQVLVVDGGQVMVR